MTSESRFQRLFEFAAVGMLEVALNGQVLLANRKFCEIVGYSLAELLTKNFTDITHPDDIDKDWENVNQLLAGHAETFTMEKRYIRSDGSAVWALLTVGIVREDNGTALNFISVVQDISEQKAARDQIRKLSQAVEHSPVSVVITDREGTIEYVNPIFTEVTGYTLAEAVGQNPRILKSGNLPQEFYHTIWETILAGRVWRGEFINKRKNGEEYWESASISPIYNHDGMITHFVAVKEDVTSRKLIEKELQNARQAAEGANKAKSMFVANISHEIRTPLNAILGFSQLLSQDRSLTADQQEKLAIVNRSGEHLLSIINDVLEISKIEAGRIQLQLITFDLHRFLADVESLFRIRTQEKKIWLAFELAEGLPRHIHADEGKLRQIFLNLIGNAIKFSDSGGITVRVAIVVNENLRPVLSVEVKDHGIGINRSELEKIFGYFEQVEQGSQAKGGAGLGLAISREFIKLMGGKIAVDSERGKGTTFHFEVPVGFASPPATHQNRETAGQIVRVQNNQLEYRILVVDDNEIGRMLLVGILKAAGFVVIEAVDGQQAIAAYQQSKPHLILMDLNMPIMDGYEASKKIRRLPAGTSIAIIAVTTSSFAEDRQAILDSGIVDIIIKPFKAQEILEKVGQYINVNYLREAALGHDIDKYGNGAPVQAMEVQKVLPDNLVASLRVAVVNGDIDLIDELLTQAEQYDLGVSQMLRKLANSYEFEKLVSVLAMSDA